MARDMYRANGTRSENMKGVDMTLKVSVQNEGSTGEVLIKGSEIHRR